MKQTHESRRLRQAARAKIDAPLAVQHPQPPVAHKTEGETFRVAGHDLKNKVHARPLARQRDEPRSINFKICAQVIAPVI